nr:alpha/beta hydrolase [Microbacterium immunditiarum]
MHGGSPGRALWCSSSDLWGPFAESLAASHRVIMIDLPGAGGTRARGLDDLTFAGAAHAVLGVAHELGLEAAHLVGHDDGGLLAIVLARTGEYPFRARSVSLLNATEAAPTGDMPSDVVLLNPPSGAGSPQLWALERMSFSTRHLDGLAPVLEDLTSSAAHTSAVEIVAQPGAAGRLRSDLLFTKGQMFAWARDHGYDVPIQLIWGADDPLSEGIFAVETMNFLATTSAELSLSFVHRAGHLAFREKPDEVAGHVTRFIQRFADRFAAVPA